VSRTTTVTPRAATGAPVWRIVAGRELRDLWLTGRGLPLMLGYAVLLSITSYLTASNRALNFLEQRETVGLTVQIAVAVAALLVLVSGADSISGERDRGTLEPLLLAPAPRRAIVVGKWLSALSLWAAAFVVSLPYVWYLGRGTRVTVAAVVGGFVVGGLLALFAGALGLVLSIVSSSSRLSLSGSMFLLLALYAPTQLPAGTRQSWFGDLLLRVDPFTAGLRYLGKVTVNAHGPATDAGWLVGPVVLALVLCAVLFVVGDRLTLRPGDRT
jgi:ABC-2 type transport system permease protein